MYKNDNFCLHIESIFKDRNTFTCAIAKTLSLKALSKVKKNDIKSGYVYFLHDGIYCKIGATRNKPSTRASQLRVGNKNIKLIGFIKSEKYKTLEKQLHKRYFSKNISGEWFNLTINIIKNILKEYNL